MQLFGNHYRTGCAFRGLKSPFFRKGFYFQRGIFGLKHSQIVGGCWPSGLSLFLMNLCACFVVILINKEFENVWRDLAIGAYGIVNRIVFLFIMIVMGFNQGMQPIAGYNFGARQFDRLIQVLKYTIFLWRDCYDSRFSGGTDFFPGH